MSSLAFCLSLAALLFAPGPTNALLALAGAEAGFRRTLRLLPVVMLAYAATVVPLSMLGAELMQQDQMARMAVTLAAAAWVGWMAVTLWRRPEVSGDQAGEARGLRLFITTLLNPKAFIIGLVLIPAQASRAEALALFFVLLIAAAVAWAALGGAFHGKGALRSLPLLRRICAGWLGLIALWLGSAALA